MVDTGVGTRTSGAGDSAGLGQCLAARAGEHPRRVALVTGGGRYGFDELAERTAALAVVLAPRLGDGAAAALLLGNTAEFVVGFFAVVGAGGVALPLNPELRTAETVASVREAGARLVLATPATAAAARQVGAAAGVPVIVLDELAVVDEAVAPAAEPTAAPDRPGRVAPGDALWQFSSGSTGASKLVARTGAALEAETGNFRTGTGVHAGDVVLCTIPLFHAHGLANALLAWAASGATLVLADGRRRARTVELIEAERVTVLPTVPFMAQVLAATPAARRHDLSSLRLCFTAGAPLPRPTFDAFLAVTGAPLRQLYGCTEAGSITLNLDPDPTATAGSVGRPLGDVEVVVLDDDGAPVPAGEVGNVAIRSRALFRGYLTADGVDRSSFRGELHLMGDTGRLDAEGRLHLVGRRTAFINSGGNKVDPAEVEGVIGRVPGVAEVVVVGVPDPVRTEVVKAVVVGDGPSSCTVDDVLAACRLALADFKVPRIVELRDELPRSPIGKILKKYLV